jgi:hypothetical protein
LVLKAVKDNKASRAYKDLLVQLVFKVFREFRVVQDQLVV